jgi:hypothetical protein
LHNLGGEVRIDFEKYKPVNVHHDIVRTHAVSFGVTKEILHSEFDTLALSRMYAGFGTTFGNQWIPNSRTLVSASLVVNYTYYHSFIKPSIPSDDDHRVDLSLKGTANYFISYRTRFFADFTMNYNYHSNGNFILVDSHPVNYERINNGFHVGLNGGITVSIF